MGTSRRSGAVVVLLAVLGMALAACGGSSSGSPAEEVSSEKSAGADGGGSGEGSGGGSSESTTATVDVSSVDACTLLDEADVQKLTGSAASFTTQKSRASCFWAATTPSVKGYVEVRLDMGFPANPPQGCTDVPVDGVGEAAKGFTCAPNPQTKVWLVARDRGAVVSMEVNESEVALTPTDMVPTMSSVLARLG